MKHRKAVINRSHQIVIYGSRDIVAGKGRCPGGTVSSYAGVHHIGFRVVIVSGAYGVDHLSIAGIHLFVGGTPYPSISAFHKIYVISVSQLDLSAFFVFYVAEFKIRII